MGTHFHQHVRRVADTTRLMPLHQHKATINVAAQLSQDTLNQGSNQVPLVSKYHHPIVCFRANHTANTLGRLPLNIHEISKFQEILLETLKKIKGANQKALLALKTVLLPKHQMSGSRPLLSEKSLLGTPIQQAISCKSYTDKRRRLL